MIKIPATPSARCSTASRPPSTNASASYLKTWSWTRTSPSSTTGHGPTMCPSSSCPPAWYPSSMLCSSSYSAMSRIIYRLSPIRLLAGMGRLSILRAGGRLFIMMIGEGFCFIYIYLWPGRRVCYWLDCLVVKGKK